MDARLLDAAKQTFLARGYEATTCEQVAIVAGAGKASLYARYPNKEALFAAVVSRNVEQTLASTGEAHPELELEDRLQAVGLGLLDHSLRPDVLAMMRMIIATAPKFPELARLGHRIGKEAGVARVMQALTARQRCDAPALARARRAAERFIDLVFPAHQMSALMGIGEEELAATAGERVAQAVEVLALGRLLEGFD